MDSLKRYNNDVLAWQYEYSELDVAHEDDINFYINKLKGSDGKVLEMACGTGRITIPLKKAGVDVIGLDQADAMIKIAKQKTAKEKLQIPYVVGDAVTYRAKYTFSNIIIPYNSLSLIPETKLRKLFFNIKNQLTPDGHFIFDINRKSADIRNNKIKNLSWSEPVYIKEVDSTFRRKIQIKTIPNLHLNRFTYHWEIARKNSKRTIVTKMDMSLRPVKFYLNLLKPLGFRLHDNKSFITDKRMHYFLDCKLTV